MDNLEIYNRARAVPEEAQKSFNNGRFSGTDINPMWRIKKLTELFGPAGFGWYYEIISQRSEVHGDQTIAVVDLNLFVKIGDEWSKPIYGTGGNVIVSKGKTSDEGYKMALTDALSVACKALGIGADVYFAKDKTKYTEGQDAKEEKKPELVCADCGNPIYTVTHKDGQVKLTAEEIAQRSLEAYGRPLCMKCARQAALDRAQAEIADKVS